jgi:hypothetical protein
VPGIQIRDTDDSFVGFQTFRITTLHFGRLIEIRPSPPSESARPRCGRWYPCGFGLSRTIWPC